MAKWVYIATTETEAGLLPGVPVIFEQRSIAGVPSDGSWPGLWGVE
jgi:hypothetical protein